MSDEAVYYVMDARSVVGNCALWWRPNGQGYTCDINDAGLYTLAAARRMRDTDIPIHKDSVAPLIISHVRVDHLRQAGHLAEYDRRKSEQAKSERARKKRRDTR